MFLISSSQICFSFLLGFIAFCTRPILLFPFPDSNLLTLSSLHTHTSSKSALIISRCLFYLFIIRFVRNLLQFLTEQQKSDSFWVIQNFTWNLQLALKAHTTTNDFALKTGVTISLFIRKYGVLNPVWANIYSQLLWRYYSSFSSAWNAMMWSGTISDHLHSSASELDTPCYIM